MRKKICVLVLSACVWSGNVSVAREKPQKIELTLKEAVLMAQTRSVEAAVALNELKRAYWEYRTYRADQLPEVAFTGTLPAYKKEYNRLQLPDGSYNYVLSNMLGMNGEISVSQNIPLTGGQISLRSSLDYTRQLGKGAYNEFMSIPVGVTLSQPIFGVNDLKWKRRIEPVRYQEAKAAYIQQVENVTLTAIDHFFNLLLAQQNLEIARQNLANADKLYEIAIAKRKIGHISETELIQLKQSSLQAKARLTEMQSELNARMFAVRSFLALEEDIQIDPVISPAVPGIRMDYREVLEKALENNSFAKNILRRRLEADYEVAVAKGNRRSINLFASVGYIGKDHTAEMAYRHLKDNQIVEMGVTIPLLDSPLVSELLQIPLYKAQTVRLSDANIYKCTHASFIDRGCRHRFYLIEMLTHEVFKAERKAYEQVIRLIAHEVNNTTAGILSVLDTLLATVEEEEELAEVLRVSMDRCSGMSRFITRFADVVRIPEPRPVRQEVNALVRSCLQFMETVCHDRRIRLVTELADVSPVAGLDAVLFQQVLVNIIKNAVESIGEGGTVYIRTISAPPGLEIADTGRGIDKDAEAKLFSPFFSTKPQGQGLGLIFIREVLTKHGCSFSLRTYPDGLTRFKIGFASPDSFENPEKQSRMIADR